MAQAKLVNVVGGGSLDDMVVLEEIYQKLSKYDPMYEPEQINGLHFTLPSSGVTVRLFTKGSYHLAGGNSIDTVTSASEELLNILNQNLSLEFESSGVEIRNLVFSGNVGRELDLSSVSEDIEGTVSINKIPTTQLKYQHEEIQGTILLYSTGSYVYTGAKTKPVAKRGIDIFTSKIDSLFES